MKHCGPLELGWIPKGFWLWGQAPTIAVVLSGEFLAIRHDDDDRRHPRRQLAGHMVVQVVQNRLAATHTLATK